MRNSVLAMMVLLLASPAAAQSRTPAQRQILGDLSRVLGESHALRQLCQGKADQYWRDQMQKLIEAEHPDRGLEDSLEADFNAGYAARQGQFASCTPAARQALSQTAAKGSALSRRLAKPEG